MALDGGFGKLNEEARQVLDEHRALDVREVVGLSAFSINTADETHADAQVVEPEGVRAHCIYRPSEMTYSVAVDD